MRTDYVKIVVISVLYRIFMLLGNWGNTFIGSVIPYPLQPDPYYYYKILELPKVVIFILPMIFLCVGLIFFYKIMRFYFDEQTSFLGTIGLSLFYPFFIQTYMSYTDTPTMIFMFMMFIVYEVIMVLKYSSRLLYSMFIILVNIFVLSQLWAGWKIVPLTIFLGLVLIIYKQIKYKKTFLGLGVLILILLFSSIMPTFIEYLGLFNVISELRPNWNPIWLIFNVLIFIILFDLFKRENGELVLKTTKDKFFILSMALIFTVLSMIMRRWTYLAMPFIVLILFFWMSKKSKTVLNIFVIFIIILSAISSLITFSNISPLMNQESEQILNNLENRTILCNWANGHVYNLFTDGETLYKAHPIDFDRWKYALQNDSKVFMNMTKEPFYLILSEWDKKMLNTSMDSYELIYNTTILEVYEVNGK